MIEYESDANFLQEMARVANVFSGGNNFVKVRAKSLQRLVALALKGVNA